LQVVRNWDTHWTFFRLTREESRYIKYFPDFKYIHPFRRYSPSNFEVVRNRAEFCMFFAPYFFLGGGETGRPQNFGPKLFNRTHFPSSCKISRRSAYGAGRFREEKKTDSKTLTLSGGVISISFYTYLSNIAFWCDLAFKHA